MRDAKFYITLGIGVFWAGLASATNQEIISNQTEQQDDSINTPVITETIHRKAWHRDNYSKMSTFEQLKSVQQNNPGLDNDSMIILNRGLELMKKMNLGLGEKNLTGIAETKDKSNNNSVASPEKSEISLSDALSALDIV
ncbi:MAG: hypothetical protein SPL08_05355, partial [Pseudomonadota bacterium]|nr:hypothetical protein [Pseudomonadota bacterium]